MTLVIRITPHRIERAILLLIILFFILSSNYYANKYYETTSEDNGYLDKLYSGTFFANIPTELEITTPENNISNDTLNVTNISNMNVTEEVPEEEAPEEATTNTTDINTTITEEDTNCTEADFKVVNFDTEKIEGSWREGIIESINLSYCNLEDTENYMMAEIYFWNQFDEEEGDVNRRKITPFYETQKTISLLPKETYIKEYTIDKSILTNPKFSYKINYYYVDKDGDKIDTTAIKSISSTYIIK
ncbi:MAG: hypothetical protein U9R34_01535 [Nanoarchaeota archaeon]|nr:hypothetical protein [Nanoarchaeota archaeon]